MSRTKEKRKKLTPMERAALPGVCEKWNRIALCSLPADRDEAERGAVELYKAVGLQQPKEFIWFDSYQNAFEIHGSGHEFQQHGSNLWPVFGWINRSGWNWAMYHFAPRVLHSVSDTISESITVPLGLAQLRDAVGYRHSSGRILNLPICYGQGDADWFAFLDFFSTVIGFPHGKDLSGLMRIVSSCGFFWPGVNKVAFFERPLLLRFDDRRRPHSVEGPAIQYPGGLTVYAIHGVPVPRKYIETPSEKIDLAEVLQEQNAEVRMAVIGKVGFKRL
ncbi:MAG: hypothetical protein IH857_05600, partial [Deltaproteobacteria bacterium]|nr:hypothetical protein [Deltaproteobacteria bacterium]